MYVMKDFLKYSLFSIPPLFLAIIFLSCSSKKNQESDSIVESAGIGFGFDTAASHYPIHEIFNDHPNISDGEAEHTQTLSQEEMRYHSKRGVSTLEDAYLEGYEDGYEDGEEDGSRGKRHGHFYDPDSEFTGKFEESYNTGYDDGYNDGYNSSLDDDDDDYDE